MLIEFKNLDKENKCQSWKDLTSRYNINDVVYSVLLKLCDSWIKSKLQVGTKKFEFPIEARKYVEWTINLSREKLTSSLDLPWFIYAVSLPIEGIRFLERHFVNPISIGLCVLDTMEDVASNMEWGGEKISNILNGIMAITGGSIQSQYVLLAFLNNTDYVHLQGALQNMHGIVKKQFIGALHFFNNAPCIGAIEFFTVMVFLSKGDVFEGLTESIAPGTQATILDTGLLNIDIHSVETVSDIKYLIIKKKLLIKQSIQKYCIEDCRLVDIFSNGFISKIGLEQKKEVMCLVESIEDQRKLGTRLLDFAKSQNEIREWTGLPGEQLVQPLDVVIDNENTTTDGSISGANTSLDDFLNFDKSM